MHTRRSLALLAAWLALPVAAAAQVRVDTVAVTIVGQLAEVLITPAGPLHLAVGDTVTFGAMAITTAGDTVPATGRWVSLDTARLAIDSLSGHATARRNTAGQARKLVTFQPVSNDYYLVIAALDFRGELHIVSAPGDSSMIFLNPDTAVWRARWAEKDSTWLTTPAGWLLRTVDSVMTMRMEEAAQRYAAVTRGTMQLCAYLAPTDYIGPVQPQEGSASPCPSLSVGLLPDSPGIRRAAAVGNALATVLPDSWVRRRYPVGLHYPDGPGRRLAVLAWADQHRHLERSLVEALRR